MKQSRLLVFALLVLALWGCGRKLNAVAPDTNKSPETVLVATPYDTTFLKTPNGGIPTAVIYRYHAHWYGVDPDGRVNGFLIVVTDTNGSPTIAQFLDPRSFTTRTDSIFTFQVKAGSQRYPHSLWVTAIDDKGKADFSPAHVILNAEDRYLPEPVFDEAYATSPGGRRFPLTDNDRRSGHAPRDTIPIGSRVYFRWHSTTADPYGRVVGYKIRIGSGYVFTRDTIAEFDASMLALGRNEFHLRAVDAVGGETGSDGGSDSLRIFSYNFGPGTWLADPNTMSMPAELRPMQRRYLEVADGKSVLRTESDGDTLARTSNIRLAFGGWDRDGQVRGFAVKVSVTTSGGGGLDLPPTPSTPPPGSAEVFEPYLHDNYEFNTASTLYRSGIYSFTGRAFDYQGQLDPQGSSIRIVVGRRPYFRASEIFLSANSIGRQNAFQDTVVLNSITDAVLTVEAPAHDGNLPPGSSPIVADAAYDYVLDPEGDAQVFEKNDGTKDIPMTTTTGQGNKPLTPGLHILEITANDYLQSKGQRTTDGRIAKVRIPFFYGQKTP